MYELRRCHVKICCSSVLTKHGLEPPLVLSILRLDEEREVGVHLAHIDHSL